MHARVYVPSLWKTGCPKYEHQCRSDRDGWSLDAAGMEEGCHGDAFDVRSNKRRSTRSLTHLLYLAMAVGSLEM